MDKFNAIKHLVNLFNVPYEKARQTLIDNDWNLLMAINDLLDE